MYPDPRLHLLRGGGGGGGGGVKTLPNCSRLPLTRPSAELCPKISGSGTWDQDYKVYREVLFKKFIIFIHCKNMGGVPSENALLIPLVAATGKGPESSPYQHELHPNPISEEAGAPQKRGEV